MRYGVAITDAVDARMLADLAVDAEAAGWHGVFYWDGGRNDAWMALAAAAMRTERVRLGTMVTPLPRQQPWKVASEAATLDQLSGGRAVLPVGLGVVEFETTGISKDYTVRARMLDEGLEVVAGLWTGQPYHFEGAYYRLEETTGPTPVQTPRVPIWVVGGPKQSQIRRAARWDGAMIQGTPDQIRERVAAITALRASARPLEVITEAETPGDDPERAAETVRPFAEAGVTWWMEAVWHTPYESGGVEGIRRRIEQGPPPYDRAQ